MNSINLTDYILKPENRQYVDISLSEPWGISNHIAKSNGLGYNHRGVKQIDEKIIITTEWKNKSYNVDSDLFDFIQKFSNSTLSKEELKLEKIVRGNRAASRHTLGYFAGFMLGGLGLLPAFDMLKNNDGNAYYALACSSTLMLFGIYSGIALITNIGTKEYNKFSKIISAAENADYFIRNNLSKDVFERMK